jgi:hypothetical protein
MDERECNTSGHQRPCTQQGGGPTSSHWQEKPDALKWSTQLPFTGSQFDMRSHFPSWQAKALLHAEWVSSSTSPQHSPVCFLPSHGHLPGFGVDRRPMLGMYGHWHSYVPASHPKHRSGQNTHMPQ